MAVNWPMSSSVARLTRYFNELTPPTLEASPTISRLKERNSPLSGSLWPVTGRVSALLACIAGAALVLIWCTDGVRMAYGSCTDIVRMVYGWCTDGVRMVYGSCTPSVDLALYLRCFGGDSWSSCCYSGEFRPEGPDSQAFSTSGCGWRWLTPDLRF